MFVSLRWLFDPDGWKSKLFPSYMPLFDNHLSLNDNNDYLNKNYSMWDQTNNDSRTFIELYNKAKFETTHFSSHFLTFFGKK